MSSFVPDFIINPVLRQARRLSSSFATSRPDTPIDTTSVLDKPAFDDDASQGALTTDLGQTGSTATVAVSALTTLLQASLAPPASAMPPPPPSTDEPSTHALTPSPQTLHEPEHDGPLSIPVAGFPAPLSVSAPQGPGHVMGDGGRSRLGDSGDSTGSLVGSLPAGFYGNVELPEDDGMQALRQRILAVQSRDISSTEKAYEMHSLLMENYEYKCARKTAVPVRPLTPSSPRNSTISAASAARIEPAATPPPPAHSGPLSGPLETLKSWHASYASYASYSLTAAPAPQTFALTEDDLRPTYVPESSCDEDGRPQQLLGCEHYRRNVKMQCFTCERWYTCRMCHNEAEDHALPRHDTKNMLCMLCGHPQRVGDVCVKCGESAARYYCSICKLWNDDADKSIYHCSDCGICRVGEGLGKDFFHCKVHVSPSVAVFFFYPYTDRQKCGSCIAINQEESHRCREGVMDCDCPICGEYIFTTRIKVVTMKCGHMIHDDCRAEYIKRSYKCPICNKSVENMESMFRRLDKHLEEQPMPDEYKDTRAVILCNDCEAKTSTKYHWGGLRCEVCLSYNTVELLLLHPTVSHNIQGTAGVNSVPGNSVEHAAHAPSAATESASSTQNTLSLPQPLHTAGSALLPPEPSLPSPPLSSSPRSDSGSERPASQPRSPAPKMSFRSASPAFMTSPTRAPIQATAPPGYSEHGFQPDSDDDDYAHLSDVEDADAFGIFDRRSLSWRKVSPFFSGGKGSDKSGDDETDEGDNEEEDEDEDEDDDDDDDDEEEIQLFGHR